MRTILDESTASYWTDAECYAALADGQNEVIKELLNVYRLKRRIDPALPLPYELESVLNDEDNSTGDVDPTVISVPTGFMALISATYDHDGTGGEKPCYIVDLPNIRFTENNALLTADGNNPRIFVRSIGDTVKLEFLPANTANAPYVINFIKTPADIASGQNPTLPVSTHSAIVNYAVARMFQKDDRPQEANRYYQLYLSEIKSLINI